MNRNPTPKSEFVKNTTKVADHKRLLDNQSLFAALETAMLEMSRQICNNAPADNMGACAASHLRMLGAQDFVQIFLNLAEEALPAAKMPTGNLPGNVTQMPKRGN